MYTKRFIDFIKRREKLLSAVSKMIFFSLIGAMLTGCSGDSAGNTSGDEQTAQISESSLYESTPVSGGKSYTSDANDSRTSQDSLEVRFLKVGKADAIVLMCGEETMVIDCGEEDDGKELLAFLKSRGIKNVDVLMITHFDKDHVGGADTIVEGFPVKRMLLPNYTGSGTEYTEFMAAIEKAGITQENVTENLSFMLGNATILVEPPASYEIPAGVSEYDNDFSLITTVEFSGKRLVFTGDAEKKRIREWLTDGSASECDVLKIPHHGVYNKALQDLLSATKPSHTVICDSKKNPADTKTLELIRKIGADCMQTQYGDITVICSGGGIEIHQ